jgi:hypothetical protein
VKASIGLAHDFWRNTEVEDWHASRWGLHDGEMMRNNSIVVKLIRQMLLDERALVDIAYAVTDPQRRLADGRTLQQYAGKRLMNLRRDVLRKALYYGSLELAYGRDIVLDWKTNPLFSNDDWHGTKLWVHKVGAFCRQVDNPDDPRWDLYKEKGWWPLDPRPADIVDTDELRRLLLEGPELLSEEAAQWCVSAGLEYALGFEERRQALQREAARAETYREAVEDRDRGRDD